MSFYANICGTLIAAEAIRNGGKIMNRKESFALRVKSVLASTFRGILRALLLRWAARCILWQKRSASGRFSLP